VKAPRFRIAWIMVAVAIAAVDFGLIRASLGPRAILAVELLIIGALPMANVLVVGILIARQRLKSRPFLLGFEVFGAIALALYIYLATSSPPSPLSAEGPIEAYLRLAFEPLYAVIGSYLPLVRAAIGLLLGIVMLVGPQLVFAVIGGLLSRRFKIDVTRR
jgi:hypothetical protein